MDNETNHHGFLVGFENVRLYSLRPASDWYYRVVLDVRAGAKVDKAYGGGRPHVNIVLGRFSTLFISTLLLPFLFSKGCRAFSEAPLFILSARFDGLCSIEPAHGGSGGWR